MINKNNLYFIVILFIGILLASGCININSESEINTYTYPVQPGTDEWKSISGHDEMVAVCRIPDDILKNLSTSGLIDTILNYPLYGDMRAYNTLQQGFSAMSSQFNGFQELYNRQDAGEKLIEKYRSLDPAAIDADWSLIQKGDYDWSIQNIEVLLVQDAIQDKLNDTQKANLLQEAIAKYRTKLQYGEVYSKYSQQTSLWLAGRTLQNLKYEPFVKTMESDISLQDFLNNGSFPDESDLKEILLKADTYLTSISP